MNWMIYGAYGYTGRLVADEAVCRGHKPILAGRSAKKLAPLAKRLGLDHILVDLENEAQLAKKVREFDLVFNSAGPFVHTGVPIVQACLDAGVNYLDVTGEIPVIEHILSLDQPARQKGIALVPGVGFNVIASDCLAAYVAGQMKRPTRLEIATAVSIIAHPSPGTAKTMVDAMPDGTLARKQGRLVRVSVRKGRRRIRFADQERTVLPASLGDLVTVFETTLIPDIATYLAFPEALAKSYSRAEPILRTIYKMPSLRWMAQKWYEKNAHGPDEQMRQTDRSQVWVRVSTEAGVEKQAWLETLEAYRFTAVAGVRAVEKALTIRPQGALTPARAFGTDFVLEIPDTKRIDRLEGNYSPI